MLEQELQLAGLKCPSGKVFTQGYPVLPMGFSTCWVGPVSSSSVLTSVLIRRPKLSSSAPPMIQSSLVQWDRCQARCKEWHDEIPDYGSIWGRCSSTAPRYKAISSVLNVSISFQCLVWSPCCDLATRNRPAAAAMEQACSLQAEERHVTPLCSHWLEQARVGEYFNLERAR